MRLLFGQLARFGVVGLGGLVLDVGIFNLLRLTVLAPDEVAAHLAAIDAYVAGAA